MKMQTEFVAKGHIVRIEPKKEETKKEEIKATEVKKTGE